jgi:hypothetical protein
MSDFAKFIPQKELVYLLNLIIHMAVIECKVAMCISRLLEFELLFNFKQKKGTSLVKLVFYCVENPGYDRASVRPSYILWITRTEPLGPCLECQCQQWRYHCRQRLRHRRLIFQLQSLHHHHHLHWIVAAGVVRVDPHAEFSLYITGTDRRSVRVGTVWTVLKPTTRGMQWSTLFLLEY